MLHGGAVEGFTHVAVEDFTPGPRQDLAAIIERGMLDGKTVDLIAYCRDEAIRLGRPHPQFVAEAATSGFTGTTAYYARRVREASIHREMVKAGTRFMQRLGQVSGPHMYDAVDDLTADIDGLPRLQVDEDDTFTLNDIMGLDTITERYTLPKLLRHNERLVMTGTEGSGKSVLIYQLLTGAAFGVDTFTRERVEPQRVMFIDVENNAFQTRWNLDKLVPTLREQAEPGFEPNWWWAKQRVVDLLATQDRANLLRRISHYKPDILYMGTAYKLTAQNDEAHRSVRAIQSFVDRVRAEIECSVMIEHHAGHGFQNDRNGMRPEGSSYWLRWPDLGKGLSPVKDSQTRLMKLKSWRGDRRDDREWPVAVKQANTYPWAPVYRDEWECMYEQQYGEV